MAVSSIYKLAEKARSILDKVAIEILVDECKNCYGLAIKKEWYENKADGVGEVDGVFLVPFKDLTPILDLSTDCYYIVNPSSYLRLPCEYGVNYVGFAKGQTSGFVRISAGSQSMWANLKANVLGGNQTYFIEGNRTYFPKMTNTSNGDIMVRYVAALDQIDPEQDLNIPPDMQAVVVDMVVAKFQPKPEVKPETL